MNGIHSSDDLPKLPGGWWSRAGTLPQVAIFLVIFAAAWFLLKELAPLLRPLLVATLFCYIILPIHTRLHRTRSQTATIFIMAGGTLMLLVVFGVLIVNSALEFNDELPKLADRADAIGNELKDWSEHNLPEALDHSVKDALKVESHGAARLSSAGQVILKHSADIFIETLVIVLYIIFLLFEAKRLARRFESGFQSEYANRVHLTVQSINLRISSYLRAKALSSLILALPLTVVYYIFGLKFAALWGVLTFFCNYIPYVGTLIAAGGSIAFGFLDLPPGWQPFALLGVVIAWHSISASFIEPLLLGNAVGLSPLVILISLTFWGLCWGLVGMFLAIPLTVTLKIVLANIDATKPIAALLGDQ